MSLKNSAPYMLAAELLTEHWILMIERFGQKWVRRHGEAPIRDGAFTAAALTWGQDLAGLDQAALVRGYEGLKTLKPDACGAIWPPESLEFRALCLGARDGSPSAYYAAVDRERRERERRRAERREQLALPVRTYEERAAMGRAHCKQLLAIVRGRRGSTAGEAQP